MFFAHRDDVLIKVTVRRELHKPILSVELEWDGAYGLTSSHSGVARKSEIFRTQSALGITGLCLFGKAYLFGCFFGFGEVDCNDNFASFAVVFPDNVFIEVFFAQIRTVDAESVEHIACRFRPVVRRDIVKHIHHFGRGGHAVAD